MDLFEYQGKQYFARFDIPVSPGDVAYTVDEAVAAAEAAGYPVVVKAQVQVGGRGKAGGIKLADNADEVRLHAGNIIGMDIKGHLVKRVWVEHASDIVKEYYASYSLDRAAKKHLLMLSAEGGVEIETVAVEHPDAIVLLHIDPVDGLSPAVARDAAVRAKIDAEAVDGVADMLVKLYRCFTEGDCDLAEINPLILRPDGGVHALDAAGEPALILAAETVLATGGAGRMFRYTTNGPWAAGDGLAMALVAGARTAALEFVQFHPTALRVDTDPLPLLTEALRGAGARLVTDSGDLLMAGRHPLGDLAPRDVVARAVWECAQTGAEVLLDATRVFSSPAGTAFPGARATSLAHGIDPASTYLPVTAAAHYHMGGVVVDDEGRTTVPGLWACGEVSYTGLHGANRLASNSLLEAVVCGRSAGAALARRPIEPRGPAVAFIPVATTEVEAAPLWHALRVRMWEAMGPVRDGASLYAAITATRAALQSLPENEHVLRQRHELALAMMQAALAREESRGAHFRRDFPTRDESRDGPRAVYPRAVA